jgi:hypothetical protein
MCLPKRFPHALTLVWLGTYTVHKEAAQLIQAYVDAEGVPH